VIAGETPGCSTIAALAAKDMDVQTNTHDGLLFEFSGVIVCGSGSPGRIIFQ
jgi:hypothetical protein